MMPETKNFNLILISIFSIFLFHCSSMAIACRSCTHGRYSRPRACFANQKTIAGAIEMYNLDHNCDVTEITEELLDDLKEEGYLQSIPLDPGFPEDGSTSYFLFTDGRICCLNHGFIQHGIEGLNANASPFDQLKANGEMREHILSRASHNLANGRSPIDQVGYEIILANETLFAWAPVFFFFWFPLSLWRLRKWRSGQSIKLALLGTSFMSLCFDSWHNSHIFFLSFTTLLFLLMLDLLIFTGRMLYSTEPMKRMIKAANCDFYRMDESRLKRVRATFNGASRRHEQMVAAMKWIVIPASLPFILWVCTKQANLESILWFLIATAIIFLGGAATGVIRFCNGVEAVESNPDSDGTIPLARSILTALLFIVPMLGYGRFAVNTSLAVWPAAGCPLLLMAAFFEGRSLTVARLNSKFIGLFKMLPYMKEKGTIKKQTSPRGITAHPGRLTSSTMRTSSMPISPCNETGLEHCTVSGGLYQSEVLSIAIPLPEAKLSLTEATCPVCGEGFADNEAWICNDCNTPHHSDCWKFNGTCTTFGCNSQSVAMHHL